MASMTAAEALLEMLLTMDKQEVIELVQVHQITEANKVGEGKALEELDCEVLDTIPCSWKSPFATPGETENPTEETKLAARVSAETCTGSQKPRPGGWIP